MPKIRFSSLPRPVWEHLLARVAERQVSLEDLSRLQEWVKTAPSARFILCGSGEFPKTVLAKGMKPFGDPVE